MESEDLKLLIDRTIQLTSRDEMNHHTNVKANMAEYKKLVFDQDFV